MIITKTYVFRGETSYIAKMPRSAVKEQKHARAWTAVQDAHAARKAKA